MSVISRGRIARLVLVLTAAAATGVGGCGAPDDESARPTPSVSVSPAVPKDLPDLPTGTGGVGPGDRVRSAGTSLVVRGRRIPLAPLRADAIAVVPGGVFFRNGTELWFTDLTRARPTGFEDVTSLVVSADGLRIGFVDLGHGPKDKYGTRLALATAYDASTGRALVATYAGMGDLATDDLARLYASNAPAVLGFTADAMRLRGVGGRTILVLLGGATTTS